MIRILHLLYTEKSIIGRLYCYFSSYFETFSAPTAETLFLLILSVITLESADSIRFLYKHFLSKITEKSLNAFYYACSYAKADYSGFMTVTARIALGLIPECLISQPIFLCIDDTLVPKFGKKFEDVAKLFDHAAHGGSNYLNGHCFVSLMLCVPVWNKDRNKISYLAIPLGYRMWQKGKSKLVLASEMMDDVMPVFGKKQIIMLCDSWYAKENLLKLVDQYSNLDVICSARSDSVLYDLAPEPTGKRGRPAKHGKRLCLSTDFELSEEKIGDYYTGVRKVLTNIFREREVLAYVTTADRKPETMRLFFSTIFPHQLSLFCAWQEEELLNQTGSSLMQYIPLFLYRFRWKIEISYYEQKTFWSLCNYMVRSRKGIEMMINLINVAYCAMKLLPVKEAAFNKYRSYSVQEFRFVLSEQIREQVFFASFVETLEINIKSHAIIGRLEQWVLRHHVFTQKL